MEIHVVELLKMDNVCFSTVLMLLKMVVEYCECVVDIPSATPDILTRLIELLKVIMDRSDE